MADSSSYRCSLLIVDDEPAILALLVGQLGGAFAVTGVMSVAAAKTHMAAHLPDMILTDLQLADGSGLALLDWVQKQSPRTARILLTGTARVEDAADAVNCARVHRLVLKPWRAEDLLASLKQVARGLQIERSHEQLLVELEARVKARTGELEHALHLLEQKNQILEKMALTDALTGLPNRRAIELIARKELLRRTRAPAAISFALIDADRFKQVNSLYLLSGGDHVLTWLGQLLQQSVRAIDAVGRVGGEEFMVVAPGTDTAGADALGERLRAAVADAETKYHGHRIRMTVSIGMAVAAPTAAIGYEQLREIAAAALADAKATGRNKVVVRPA